MIEIKNLSRQFGAIKAVDNISFTINSGEIVGFLGPNGAGKTTTMRMMVGYLQPNSGSIDLDGKSIFADPVTTSARIGYLAEHNPLYDEMLVGEFLEYMGDLRRMSKARFRERLGYVVHKCGLSAVFAQRIGTLSKGYRQRVGLAQALLHDPSVLILDEPTSGLDPNQILEIRDLIRELGAEKTVLLSSHIMQEVQALCDRVIIINKGSIVVDDRKENLGTYMGNEMIMVLEIEASQPDLGVWLHAHPEATLREMSDKGENSIIKIAMPSEADLRKDLSQFAIEQGWQILSMYLENQSLESIFHVLTSDDPTVINQEPELPFEEVKAPIADIPEESTEKEEA